MTDTELHDAIILDAAAKALADAGNDAGCAVRMAAILPPVVVPTYLSERALVGLFADPAEGEATLEAFEAAASSTSPSAPLFKRVAAWLKDVGSPTGGVDFGSPMVRGTVDQLHTAGIFTDHQVATMKAAAERPAVVSADQVSRAWAQYRPDGRIVTL